MHYPEKVQKSESKYRSFFKKIYQRINVVKAFSYEEESREKAYKT